MNILLAEDDNQLGELIVYMLTKSGHKVDGRGRCILLRFQRTL